MTYVLPQTPMVSAAAADLTAIGSAIAEADAANALQAFTGGAPNVAAGVPAASTPSTSR